MGSFWRLAFWQETFQFCERFCKCRMLVPGKFLQVDIKSLGLAWRYFSTLDVLMPKLPRYRNVPIGGLVTVVSTYFWQIQKYLCFFPKINLRIQGNTVKLDFKELLNKEQIDFKERFNDYQLFYTTNLLLNKELLPN